MTSLGDLNFNYKREFIKSLLQKTSSNEKKRKFLFFIQLLRSEKKANKTKNNCRRLKEKKVNKLFICGQNVGQ